MGIARSTFYDAPSAPLGDAGLVARIGAICDEFECYGYRRVGAALRHQGVVVNGKKLRRLMRENGLQPKQRRRYIIGRRFPPQGRTALSCRRGAGSRAARTG